MNNDEENGKESKGNENEGVGKKGEEKKAKKKKAKNKKRKRRRREANAKKKPPDILSLLTSIPFNFYYVYGGCANAVPPYQKLRTRVIQFGRSQASTRPSAMPSLHLEDPPT